MALRFIFFLSLGLTSILMAQTIPTPTQTGTIITDPNGNNKADPGDKIRYKVTIQNTGGASATGVQLNAVPDTKTTLVSGSFRTSPLAVDDTYACTGNVGLNVPTASGLKVNDFDDNIAGLTCTAGTFTTTQNGSITIAADGSFTYSPPAGYIGTDTYTYTLNDGNAVAGVTATDNALITFTITNMIWFVNNTGGGSGGNGTLASPFKTLADFNGSTGPAAGHTIFIKNSGVNYTGGIVLKDNQILIGEGHTGTVATNENLSVALSFALAPNSATLPNIDGTRPIITNSSGDGVTLASGNSLRGFDVGACSDFGMQRAATNSVGNLVVSEVSINNTTGGGFDASNGSGTLNAIFTSITSTGGVNGINLTNCAGTFNAGTGTLSNSTGANVNIAGGTVGFTYSGNISQSNNIALVSISGGHATGTVSFQTGTLSATNGTGLQFDNADGTYNFNGTNTLNGGDAGIDILNGSAGIFNFSSNTSITRANNVSGAAFNLLSSNANVTYNGSMTLGTGTGNMVAIDNHDGGTINFNTGNLTKGSSTTQGISIQNSNAGTINFNNPTITITMTSGNAVSLTSNTGGIMNFAMAGGGNGMDLTTTSGIGFNATGGGTVRVTGSGNTITTTTGTALNVDNTTISSNNLNFQSISANGATNGIVLNTTGSSGGLIITGTGTTDGSGGTIQNITNRGVSATSTINLSLKNMTFTNANTTDGGTCSATDNSGCNAAIHLNTVTNAILDNVDINGTAQQGINLREVNGFQLLNSNIINGGAGGQTEEADLYAINLFGTCAITNSSLTVPAERAAVIYNTSKTMALTVTGSTFGMNQTQPLGADGLEVNSYGASSTTLNIVNSTFVQPKTNGLQVITEGTSQSSVNISSSTFDPGTGLAAAIDLVMNNTANMKFNILNNTSIKGKGINIVNIFAFPDATFEGRINDNTVVNNGGSGTPIRVVSQGNGNSKVEIKNNLVTGGDDYGIIASANSGSGRLDVTITGNTVSLSSMGFYGIQAIAGASSSTFTNKVCANVANNNTTGVPTPSAIGNFQARAATASHEILLQGPGPNVATNWSSNSNTPVPGITSQSGAGTFTFGATCSTPSNPLP